MSSEYLQRRVILVHLACSVTPFPGCSHCSSLPLNFLRSSPQLVGSSVLASARKYGVDRYVYRTAMVSQVLPTESVGLNCFSAVLLFCCTVTRQDRGPWKETRVHNEDKSTRRTSLVVTVVVANLCCCLFWVFCFIVEQSRTRAQVGFCG